MLQSLLRKESAKYILCAEKLDDQKFEKWKVEDNKHSKNCALTYMAHQCSVIARCTIDKGNLSYRWN